MHGEHVTNRHTVIYEGSGYDEDRPFEDLVKIMGDLANVYRLVGLSKWSTAMLNYSWNKG